MGIIHARVDERLIHGQVATVWTNSLGAQRIYVANDQAIKDEIQIGALKMAKPVGVKLTIASNRRAVKGLNSGKYDSEKVFLMTKSIKDMAYLIDNGLELTTFNVGNISAVEGSKAIKRSVALTQEDIAILQRLNDQGVNITAQMVPAEPATSILSFL